jgi:hypothetical protein
MITVEVQHSEVIVRAPYDAPEEKVMKFLLFKANVKEPLSNPTQ